MSFNDVFLTLNAELWSCADGSHFIDHQGIKHVLPLPSKKPPNIRAEERLVSRNKKISWGGGEERKMAGWASMS